MDKEQIAKITRMFKSITEDSEDYILHSEKGNHFEIYLTDANDNKLKVIVKGTVKLGSIVPIDIETTIEDNRKIIFLLKKLGADIHE